MAAEQHQEMYASKLTHLEQVTEQFTDWLTSLSAMQPGDEIFVRRFKRTGTLVRLQLAQQVAVVNMGGVDAEIPLQELMPDIDGGGEQVVSLKRQAAETLRQAQIELDEAERLKRESRKGLVALEQRQGYVNAWLAAVAELQVGSEVTFSRSPGHGTVTEMDLPAGKVTVEAGDQPLTLRLQDLFPEYGAFGGKGGGKPRRRKPSGGRGGPKADKPIPHRKAGSARARANRKAVAKLAPGSDVFVVPFHKRAKLVRIDEAKDVAIVLSGAFEMQVALADVEPLTDIKPRPKRKPVARPEAEPPPQAPDGE
jgi:hypothetical protein